MCPICGRRKGGLVCGYCGYVPSKIKQQLVQKEKLK